MEVKPVDRMIAGLAKLSADDQSRLAQALRALGVGATESKPRELGDAPFVLSCMCDQMRAMGVEFPFMTVLQRSPYYKGFQSKVPSVMEYLRHQKLNRTEMRSVLGLGVRLLYRDLSASKQAVSSYRMMSSIDLVPSILNRELPEYAKSGLISMVVRKTKRR